MPNGIERPAVYVCVWGERERGGGLSTLRDSASYLLQRKPSLPFPFDVQPQCTADEKREPCRRHRSGWDNNQKGSPALVSFSVNNSDGIHPLRKSYSTGCEANEAPIAHKRVPSGSSVREEVSPRSHTATL